MEEYSNRNYLYKGKIRVSCKTLNKDNQEKRNPISIDSNIYQHKDIDNNQLFINLPDREIILQITLNKHELGTERIDLTYTNTKMKKSCWCSISNP